MERGGDQSSGGNWHCEVSSSALSPLIALAPMLTVNSLRSYEVLLTLPVWITTCLPILSILYKTMLAFHDMPPRQAASLPSELNEKQQREMEMVQVGNRS